MEQKTEVLVCDVPEAGAMAGLSRSASYNAVKNGDMPVVRLGGLYKVPLKAWRAKLNGEA